MVSLWILQHDSLPAPRIGSDLVIWPTTTLPSPTQLRTWAGWSEAAILAGMIETGHVLAFRPHPQEWPDVALAIGSGRIWRFHGRYIAWLAEDDLAVPEIPRALALAGVDLILCRTAPQPLHPLNPLWRAVQANQVYGLTLHENPVLYLPCELDPAEEGVLALSAVPGGLRAELDFERLADARRLYPVRQLLRPGLYKQQRWWSS